MELFSRKTALYLLSLKEENKFELFKNKMPRKIQLKGTC